MSKYLRLLVMICLLIVQQMVAKEIVVVTEGEGIFLFDLAENTTLQELSYLAKEVGGNGRHEDCRPQIPGGPLTEPRNYYSSVNTQEKTDIAFIVTTLANKCLITLAKMKPDLERAGDRIDHVHPLRFLHTIFTDEGLKVAIKNIQSRGWVWDSFMGGLRTSLQSECAIGNVLETHVLDLACAAKVDPKVLMPALRGKEWDKLVTLLIRHVPRQGGDSRNRYD